MRTFKSHDDILNQYKIEIHMQKDNQLTESFEHQIKSNICATLTLKMSGILITNFAFHSLEVYK